MSMQGTNCDMVHTVPLSTVLFQSAYNTDEVTLLPFDILDAGLEVAQLN
jgi:hypothetical protein